MVIAKFLGMRDLERFRRSIMWGMFFARNGGVYRAPRDVLSFDCVEIYVDCLSSDVVPIVRCEVVCSRLSVSEFAMERLAKCVDVAG